MLMKNFTLTQLTSWSGCDDVSDDTNRIRIIVCLQLCVMNTKSTYFQDSEENWGQKNSVKYSRIYEHSS